MAGHSKWSNIKYKKKINDSKKEKKISKLLYKINNAVNLNSNALNKDILLKKIYNEASELNISKTIIQKSILKSTIDVKNSKILNYSVYVKCGIALYISCVFENKNRIISDLRCIFYKYNASLVKNDSILYLFERIYKIKFELIEEKKILPIVYKFCVKDIEFFDKYFEISLKYELFGKIKYELDNLNIKYSYIYIMFPYKYIELDDVAKNNIKELINSINKLSYVISIFSNVNI